MEVDQARCPGGPEGLHHQNQRVEEEEEGWYHRQEEEGLQEEAAGEFQTRAQAGGWEENYLVFLGTFYVLEYFLHESEHPKYIVSCILFNQGADIWQ